ncbi:hypothetical protein LOTGIDRAFT_211630 [Lottia gigantea]|uniref:Rab3 GTPase-activating protein catalytic subunit n=1 Tax=Lottia gigantea TaxID=225164 RepID=V4CQS8_LOTGI|nr:hypothetical protein LOTGIDRAFT_211630 [Lottia gigantea]ESP04825.1 hypothetical protein LOTGIDRAFT_211630 [Lottia gigantea]
MVPEDESEVFEITDFTTASDWERFIARFEEILHEWKLVNRGYLPPVKKGDFASCNWDEKCDELQFADFKFKVTYMVLKSHNATTKNAKEVKEDENEQEDEGEGTPTVFSDLMNMENDFPFRAHCLSRWYGLQEFLIITPASNTDAIDSESRSKLLLSSASVALNNTGCTIPVYVQIQQRWRKLYSGTAIVPGASVEFEMIHLKKTPPQYNHLAGLLDVFKSKLGCVYISMPPVSVSVRFTYILQEWIHCPWPQEPPDFSTISECDVGCTNFGNLPFGACVDPISELNLSCTWPSLSEDMIVENNVYSDLDPLQAPQWSVKLTMTEDAQCLLGEYLREFLKLSQHTETTDELLGNALDDSDKDQTDISQALQRLTEPAVGYNIPTLGHVVSSATTKLKMKPEEAPIPGEVLNEILLYLFPDAKKSDEKSEGKDRESAEKSTRSLKLIEDLGKQLKSSPVDGLSHRLAICFCLVNHNQGGLRAVAHLWQEFVLEMRYRWENNYYITGVEHGQPNMKSSILHQKLQMLNCCIERKIKRESSRPQSPTYQRRPRSTSPQALSSGSGDSENRKRVESGGSSSDEEFFECAEKEDEVDEGNQDSSASEAFSDTTPHSHKPEGRLAPIKDMKLLNSREQMYIPITQEPSPMTEDMLEEHAEVLAKLGSSAEGTQLRARMQSACLLSDMESFKAANPNCTLDDFVRWYSPRDYITEEVENENGEKVIKGQLSSRMKIPGNMWVEVWQGAKPIPARRQRRLFDDTKEAEKVLHFLAAMKPGQVVLHLMPMLVHAAILKVIENEDQDTENLKTLLDQVINKAAKVTRSPVLDTRKYEDLVRLIELSETVIARAKSLKTKFTIDLLDMPTADEELETFVNSLLKQPEVMVRGGPCGPAGSIIHKLFTAAQRASHMLLDDEEGDINLEDLQKPTSSVPDFPPPSAREYILRAMVPRPAPYSRVLPQKMYCVLVDDFRLAGAFSSDTTFQ